MSFLYPLGAVALATLPVILGLYILRLKRKKVTVSTNLFWRQVLEDVEANTPFQRLRYSHLLLVQLLIALLMVLALMNPAITYSSTRGLDTVLVVDTTASMGATELGSTRLANARKQIDQLIAEKAKNDRIGIIAAGRSPQILASVTADTALLKAAVEQLVPEPNGGQLTQSADLALQLIAEAQAKDRELNKGAQLPSMAGDAQGQVVFFTDDPVQLETPPESAIPVRWAVQPFGLADTTNAALIAANFTNADLVAGTMTLFLTTAYVGPNAIEAELRITKGGTLLDLRKLTLNPGEEESHLFDGVPLEAGRYELELIPLEEVNTGEKIEDALETDNRAYLVYENQDKFSILILSRNGIYGLLLSQLENVEVFQRDLSGGVPDSGFDLIIVDGDLPLNAPPANYLIIHSNNHELLPVNIVGEATTPIVSDWKATDPLLRFVNPQTFKINKMMEVEPKEWGRVVLDTNLGPAIIYGEQGQQRVVYWAFDPFMSDLPFKATFPIMLSAHVDYFRSRRGEQTLASADLLRFSTPASSVEVARPDGTHDTISAQAGEELAIAADQLGFWTLSATVGEGTYTRDFGVNLFDPGESLLPSGESFAGDTGLATFEQAKRGTHSQWRWVALAAIIFLLGEWWIYHQRIF